LVSGPNLAFGDSSNQTYSGTISGPLSLTKNGSGIQILSGDNTFTGGVTINDGTLLANNAAGSATGTGPVLVKSGATLGGTGVVGGAVTTEAGALLSPGASIDVLTVGSASGPGTYLFEYDGAAGVPIDQLSVLGVLDLTGATVDFDMLGAALTAPSYVFAAYGSLTGTFGTQVDVPAGYSINYSFSGNQIALVQIPEPTAGLLSLLGLFGFVARRRR
jgi:fibronectin-binding autotransporter adhesin